MRIAFHQNQLCLRGTTVAMVDYARHARDWYGVEPLFVYEAHSRWNVPEAIATIGSEFPVVAYTDYAREIDGILAAHRIERMYTIKGGSRDGKERSCVPTMVHAVGVCGHADVHGDVFALNSHWLASQLGNRYPAVPHMVHLPDVSADMRAELGIPARAIVIGRHGGAETFDIPFARACVAEVVQQRDDVTFLFMNTDRFYAHPRVIHLPPGGDLRRKVCFINSCDAMLHARQQGETFGLAIAEFSVRNKPVFTYAASPERAHCEMLGNKALLYGNAADLKEKLLAFRPVDGDFNCFRDYTPEKVMPIFRQVFMA
jgi:hypothetical protein